jgi:DNA-binding transcriptional LysR family regulator
MASESGLLAMDWDDLRVLNAAAECLSLSAAARRLGISQPKASRRLRALEEVLGARLFDRLPSGLAPTPAGQRLIPLVAEMAKAADAVQRLRPALPEEAGGTVRISAMETVSRFLTQRMDRLFAAAPGVEIEILPAHADVNLWRREADLQVRECLPEGADLVVRRLADIAYAVYGARDLVAVQPAAKTEARYRDCEWIGFSEDRLFFPQQKKWLDARLARPPRLRSTDMDVVLEALVAGIGLAVVPCCLADNDPRLMRLTPPIKGICRPQHLLSHRDMLREPAVRAIADALQQLFKAEQRCLAGEGMPAAAE